MRIDAVTSVRRLSRHFPAIALIAALAVTPTLAEDPVIPGTLGDEPVADARTGVIFRTVIQVDGGDAIDPEPLVGNKLIIATGEYTGPQTLEANRTLIGGGSTIHVRGLRSGRVTAFTAPGARPRIFSQTGPGLTLNGDNIHIAGMDIETADGNGISGGSDRSNIVTEHIRVETSDATGRGIRFGENNANIRLLQNIVMALDDGIRFGDGNRDIQIAGNQITTTGGGQAIRSGDDNRNIRLIGNTISAQGVSAQAIRFGADNVDLLLSDNTFDAVGGDIFVFSSTGNGLSAGSIENSLTSAPGGAVCGGSGSFTGALHITDPNGNLLVLQDGCTP